MSEWIRVGDGMPAPNVGVLALIEDRRMVLAYIVADDRVEIDKPQSPPWKTVWLSAEPNGELTSFTITHWMPLPDLPEE